MERLFSTDQVAELLGVTTWVVATWMRQGMLKGQQLPQGLVRVSERNLVSFLRDQHIDLTGMMKDIAATEQTATEKKPGPVLLPAEPLSMPVEVSAPARPAAPELAAPLVSDDEPPVHAAQQVLDAVLRDAMVRRANAVQFTFDGQELMLALRIDGRLCPRPMFHARLPQGLGGEIVAHALERAKLPAPSPLANGSISLRSDGATVTIPAWACRIGPTTRLVFTLPCEPSRVEDLLPVGHSRTLQKVLDNRSGLILLAGPMDRCRRLLAAVRRRLENAGHSVLELPRSAGLGGDSLRTVLSSPDVLADAMLVEEFTRYEDVEAVLDASRRALVVAVVPEDSPAGLITFLRRASVPGWDLARGLSAVGVLDAEGGVIQATDAALREKIRLGLWDWGL